MSASRVQLSFNIHEADWIPQDVREKMKAIHKNRIDKKGVFTVACQETSTQTLNQQMAFEQIERLIEEAEVEVHEDQWQENKLDYKDWIIQKKIREGKEHEIEKREEAIKKGKQQ